MSWPHTHSHYSGTEQQRVRPNPYLRNKSLCFDTNWVKISQLWTNGWDISGQIPGDAITGHVTLEMSILEASYWSGRPSDWSINWPHNKILTRVFPVFLKRFKHTKSQFVSFKWQDKIHFYPIWPLSQQSDSIVITDSLFLNESSFLVSSVGILFLLKIQFFRKYGIFARRLCWSSQQVLPKCWPEYVEHIFVIFWIFFIVESHS